MIFYGSAVYPAFNRVFADMDNFEVYQMVTIWARPSGCVFFFVLHGAAGDGLRLLFLPAAKKGIFSRSAAFLFCTRTFTSLRHKKAVAGFILPFMLILRACVLCVLRFWCVSRLNAGRRGVEAAPLPGCVPLGFGGGAAAPPCPPYPHRPR